MEYLLEIKNDKDRFVLEILKHFRFVKTRPLTRESAQILTDLGESVEQVKLAKKGKVKLQRAKDFLNEL